MPNYNLVAQSSLFVYGEKHVPSPFDKQAMIIDMFGPTFLMF